MDTALKQVLLFWDDNTYHFVIHIMSNCQYRPWRHFFIMSIQTIVSFMSCNKDHFTLYHSKSPLQTIVPFISLQYRQLCHLYQATTRHWTGIVSFISCQYNTDSFYQVNTRQSAFAGQSVLNLFNIMLIHDIVSFISCHDNIGQIVPSIMGKQN